MCEGKAATAIPTTTAINSRKGGLCRWILAPFRALGRARDVYVSSLGRCAGAGGGGGGRRGAPMAGYAAGMVAMMPRARSRSAFGQSARTEEDFSELVRASSQSSELGRENKAAAAVPRSQSVAPAIGRIDEEKSCDFDGDVKLGIAAAAAYPRSRSWAVVPGSRTVGFVAN